MNAFLKAMQEAQKLPEPADDAAEIPDFLSNPEAAEAVLYSRVPAASTTAIPGALQTNFEYHCARLTIGKEVTGYDMGMPIYSEIDESDELRAIMNHILAGHYLQFNKQETFLKDGTIIVWIEWGVRKEQAAKIDRTFLTEEELLSPTSTDGKDSDDVGDG